MIDKFKIFAKAGDGGHGCTSFRRGRQDNQGRPDGAFSSFLYYAYLYSFFKNLIVYVLF